MLSQELYQGSHISLGENKKLHNKKWNSWVSSKNSSQNSSPCELLRNLFFIHFRPMIHF